MSDNLNDVTQALQRVPVSRSKFYELIKTREIKTVKIGSRRLVADSAIDEYIARLSASGSDAA